MKRLLALACASLAACGPVDVDEQPEEGPFAVEVVRFTPGEGAGFGQDAMPDVVLGPPRGKGTSQGSLDVVSLGVGGEVVLRMGQDIVDEEGVDLLVFENAFLTPTGQLFAEAGEVSVSDDGESFTAFACSPEEPAPNGCAGFEPVLAFDEGAVDADTAGGDEFDLADIGVARARFVRIVDRATSPGLGGNSAGFDLDAVAVAAH